MNKSLPECKNLKVPTSRGPKRQLVNARAVNVVLTDELIERGKIHSNGNLSRLIRDYLGTLPGVPK